MKILVQSDDYGFTRSVVDGMVDAFERGIITSTGIFINMPWRDYAIEKIKPYLNRICLGIDINVVSGPSVDNPLELPTLINHETHLFIQTNERKKDPRWGKEDIFKPYNEVYIEASAQIEKFIECIGRKPEYIQTHSTSGSEIYVKALRDVAHKYEIPFSKDVYAFYNIKLLFDFPKGDPYSYENQTRNEIPIILKKLEENINEDYVLIPSHCGYVDTDLMRYSRCNIDRIYDHQMLTSNEIKDWIKNHSVSLISYRDLPLK